MGRAKDMGVIGQGKKHEKKTIENNAKHKNDWAQKKAQLVGQLYACS